MFYTTLNKIREHSPCRDGWGTLLASLGKTRADDEPLSFKTILESNGLDDAIWALRSIDAPEVRLFAVRCVRQVQHLLTDERSLRALDVAEAYAVGEATEDELWDARDAARDAWDAWDARYAAGSAAGSAAWAAVWSAAWDAAWSAAWDAARSAAWDAARAAGRAAQREDFIAIFCSEDA